MPRGRRKKFEYQHSPLKVAFLWIEIILIKIGEIPLLLTLSIANNLFGHQKRGRPRKTSILVFYLFKIKHYFRFTMNPRVKVSFAFLMILIIFFSYTYFLLEAAYQLPSPDRLISPTHPLTTEFYDRNGKLLYRLYEGRNRSLVTLDELPQYLIQATIAIEDKNFYKHFGVDPLAIIRAARHNFSQGTLEGASTITQQLIKNSLLSPEKTYQRKVKEIILSIWAETKYSKKEILAMYFNESPYGGPTWGVEAASQTYFGKPARQLSLAEATYLAGLPASPTKYSPYGTMPSLGKTRQKEVLERMAEENYITQTQADEAYLIELQFKPPINDIKAPHFVMYVKDLLAQKYGPRVVSQGGLKIYTTLDLGLQEEVQKIVTDEIDNLGSLNVQNGAAMVMDADSGQILTMIGSRDYNYPKFGNFNVTLALRQPGSSIKPVTYISAFKKGFSPGNTILDTPVTFKDEWGNSYSPINYDGKFHGLVSIRTALGSSLNIPAVKLLATTGIDSVIQTARELGISTFTDPKNYGLSLTLGGAEVRMIEMMGVYGTFSQMGKLIQPTPILKVLDSEGNVLEEYQDKSQQVLQQELAYLITHILSDNNARTMAFGPNSLLNIKDIAVKTGTSDSKRDNWTFGYSTDFVVGAWVGNPDNSPMHPSLTSGVTGAAPIWQKITKGLVAKHPTKSFQRPQGVIEVTVDGRKDLAAAGILPKGLVRAKHEKDKTTFFDTFSSYATSSATAALDGTAN